MSASGWIRFARQALLLTGIVTAGGALADSTEPWPEIALPPKAKVEWVSDSMRVNGIPMRVMRFDSSVSRAEIIEYYRAQWTRGYEMKPSVEQIGDSTVIGQAHGPYFMTVKVHDGPNGSSSGLIAASQSLGNKIERDAGDLPLMPGARVLQVVESNDPGKRSREVVAVNPAGISSAQSFYEAAFHNAGWHQVQQSNGDPAKPGRPGYFAVYQRDGSEVQLAIVERPEVRGSVLVANAVTKDTGPKRF